MRQIQGGDQQFHRLTMAKSTNHDSYLSAFPRFKHDSQ